MKVGQKWNKNGILQLIPYVTIKAWYYPNNCDIILRIPHVLCTDDNT